MTIAVPAESRSTSSNFWNYAGLFVAGAVGLGIYNSATSSPTCQFGDVRINSDVYMVNGSMDYGFEVTAPVKNVGSDGSFVVLAQLSTSQGLFERRTKYYLQKGETMQVRFAFTEPSITVGSNVRAMLKCV